MQRKGKGHLIIKNELDLKIIRIHFSPRPHGHELKRDGLSELRYAWVFWTDEFTNSFHY